MKVYFPEELNRQLYHHLRRYSLGYEKKEVLFPLCINEKNRLNLGTKKKIGYIEAVDDISYTEKCCDVGKRIGSIHTHPHDIGADDIDYFAETQYFSQSDLFGALADHINGYTDDSINCAIEPIEITKNREEFLFICKRLKNVSEDDLRNVRRDRKPDFTRESETTLAFPKLKQESLKLIKEFYRDYPFGEKLPESVIVGLKKDVVDAVKKQFDAKSGGIIYPWEEMQHTTDLDEWLDIYKKTKPKTPIELFLKKEKIVYWRKADAASIEAHLKKLGKISEASFIMVCKKAPSRKIRKGIERDKKICNWSEKELIFK